MIYINYGKKKNNNSQGDSYSGEKDMGSLNNWHILSGDSNEILNNTYGILSERSSTLYHTYAPAKAAVNKPTTYAIGPGLVFRSSPDSGRLGMSNESARDFALDFQSIVDSYQKRLGLYEKQGVLFRSALYGGDSFLWFERKEGILTDIIETQNNQIDWQFRNKDYTLGIKHDNKMRRLGVKKVDGEEIPYTSPNGDQNVIQCYFKELGRQLRGYPLVYSTINLSRNDDTHTDAITNRAVMEAVMMGWAESSGTDFAQQIKDLADANRKKKGRSWNPLKKIGNAENMGSGNYFMAQTGEKMNWGDMKAPSKTYDMFKKWNINYIGMATGTPPQVIMSDYVGSFTAHKGAFNDFIKEYMRRRKTFERTVMDIIVREILKDAIMQGYIKAPGFLTGDWMIQQAYIRGVYLGPVPGHINPLVEVKAKGEEVKQGFELRSTYALEKGHEWADFLPVWDEQQRQYSDAPQDFKSYQLYKEETGAVR